MYNVFRYSKNYSKTSACFWNYHREEPNNPPTNFVTNPLTVNYNADLITNSESFKYKSSIIGKTPNNDDDDDDDDYDNVIKDVEIVVPLKHLGNVWDSLSISLINCEVNLLLTWSKNCVLNDMMTTAGVPARGDNPARPAIAALTGATFAIKDSILYVPVVTLSAENDNKLLGQLKTRFKKTIKWNKYRSKMSNQVKNNKLNYLINPTFTKVNRYLCYRM